MRIESEYQFVTFEWRKRKYRPLFKCIIIMIESQYVDTMQCSKVIYCYADLLPLHGDKFGQVSKLLHSRLYLCDNKFSSFKCDKHITYIFNCFVLQPTFLLNYYKFLFPYQGAGLLPHGDPPPRVSLLGLQLTLWLVGFTLL